MCTFRKIKFYKPFGVEFLKEVKENELVADSRGCMRWQSLIRDHSLFVNIVNIWEMLRFELTPKKALSHFLDMDMFFFRYLPALKARSR